MGFAEFAAMFKEFLRDLREEAKQLGRLEANVEIIKDDNRELAAQVKELTERLTKLEAFVKATYAKAVQDILPKAIDEKVDKRIKKAIDDGIQRIRGEGSVQKDGTTQEDKETTPQS